MLKTIRVSLADHPYNIYVGAHALQALSTLIKKTRIGSDAVVITTKPIKALHGQKLQRQLNKVCHSVLILDIPDSEKSKNANLALRLIGKIMTFDKKKSLFLVAFGGGVVGDLTGFMAAIYKRGVPYIQIPTSLLAQIDSSIGGKTAIDTAFGKNLIGAFYQPRLVLADISLLKTLPKDQILAGLSEAVKYAVIKDPQLFTFLQTRGCDILMRKPAALTHLISRCAAIKTRIVVNDEWDKKGIRMILNFGHTFGHAMETASNFKVSHGKGVSMGMVCATRLSQKLGLLKTREAAKIISLIQDLGLPTMFKGIKHQTILKALVYDKKSRQGINRFVLIERIGKTKIVENIPQGLIRDVIGERERKKV